MKQRARAIIIEDDAVALIERQRDGRWYFAFPGGGVEKGETVEQAAAREVEEELGLQVRIGRCVAQGVVGGRPERFFLASVIDGVFGTGQGAEMIGLKPNKGTYKPVWVRLDDLSRLPVLPPQMVDLIRRSQREGWPDQPLDLGDHDR